MVQEHNSCPFCLHMSCVGETKDRVGFGFEVEGRAGRFYALPLTVPIKLWRRNQLSDSVDAWKLGRMSSVGETSGPAHCYILQVAGYNSTAATLATTALLLPSLTRASVLRRRNRDQLCGRLGLPISEPKLLKPTTLICTNLSKTHIVVLGQASRCIKCRQKYSQKNPYLHLSFGVTCFWTSWHSK